MESAATTDVTMQCKVSCGECHLLQPEPTLMEASMPHPTSGKHGMKWWWWHTLEQPRSNGKERRDEEGGGRGKNGLDGNDQAMLQ